MADIKAAVVRATINASATGQTTVTIPGSPGWTPKFCLAMLTSATSDDSADAGGELSIGFLTASAQYFAAVARDDNVGTTNTNRYISNNRAAGPASSLDLDGLIRAGTGPTTDGWVFETITSGVAAYGTFLFLGGTDCDAVVGSITGSTSGGTTTESGLGHTPSIVLFAGVGNPIGSAVHALLNFGCAWNDTSPVNVGLALASQDNVGAADGAQIVYTDRVGGQITWAAETWAGEVTAFASGEFTLTTRDGNSSGDALIYASIELAGADIWLGNMDTPTSGASDWNPTNPNFSPLVGLLAFSQLTSNDSHTAGDVNITIGATDGTRNASLWSGGEDGAATTEEYSHSSGDVFKQLDATDRSVINEFGQATLDSNGFTVPAAQLTTVNGTARKGWGLFIGDAAAGGGATHPWPTRNRRAFLSHMAR